MKIKLRILRGFALKLSIYTLLLASSYFTINNMLDARDRSIHTHQVIDKANDLLIDLLNIETGARGYAISGRKNFLQPLTDGIGHFKSDYESIEKLTSNNAKQQKALIELNNGFSCWIETEINPLMAIRSEINKGAKPVQDISEFVSSEKGKNQMDALRGILSQVQNTERDILAVRDKKMTYFTHMVLILIAYGGVAVFLLSVIIAFWTASAITKPLDRAVAYAKQVTAGNYDEKLDVDERDEIGLLGKTLQAMVKELIRHIELLENSLNDVKKLNMELSIKKRELEEFTNIAAHDLQEPLRKIQVFGDRIKTEDANNMSEKTSDYLSRMINAANRSQALVKSILEYSRVNNQPDIFMPVDLNLVFGDIKESMAQRISESHAQIEIENLPIIQAAPAQIFQLFRNLLSNSLKYSRPDTPIEIKVYNRYLDNQGAQMCEIRISDNGIGFDERYVGKIFTPFQRLHGKQEHEGVGIGLAICRRIVEQHNGTITASSSPGKGSTFTVTLPVKQETTWFKRILSDDVQTS